MKALGFSDGFVALLIFGESLGIALVGGLLGIALTLPDRRLRSASADGHAVPRVPRLAARRC